MNQNSQNFLKIRLDFHLMISYHSACNSEGNRAEISTSQIDSGIRQIKTDRDWLLAINLRRISRRRHLQPAGDLFLPLILQKYLDYKKNKVITLIAILLWRCSEYVPVASVYKETVSNKDGTCLIYPVADAQSPVN
jgi:hypothetical protein